jgi:hypothetical protein
MALVYLLVGIVTFALLFGLAVVVERWERWD